MNRLVLVVEDDPLLRRGLASLIEMSGHRVVSAGSIADAMEQLRVGPSHLLLDMNLPDGLGTTVLRHVRERALPVKLAVLSGSDDDTLLAEMRSLKPDAVFQKPPEWDAVMAWLAE